MQQAGVKCRHTAMQPLKQVLYQIDESGSGRMSYHDFYVSLPLCKPAQALSDLQATQRVHAASTFTCALHHVS